MMAWLWSGGFVGNKNIENEKQKIYLKKISDRIRFSSSCEFIFFSIRENRQKQMGMPTMVCSADFQFSRSTRSLQGACKELLNDTTKKSQRQKCWLARIVEKKFWNGYFRKDFHVGLKWWSRSEKIVSDITARKCIGPLATWLFPTAWKSTNIFLNFSCISNFHVIRHFVPKWGNSTQAKK